MLLNYHARGNVFLTYQAAFSIAGAPLTNRVPANCCATLMILGSKPAVATSEVNSLKHCQ